MPKVVLRVGRGDVKVDKREIQDQYAGHDATRERALLAQTFRGDEMWRGRVTGT